MSETLLKNKSVDLKVELLCNFCEKYSDQVECVVEGPLVNICDECVDQCVELINQRKNFKAKINFLRET